MNFQLGLILKSLREICRINLVDQKETDISRWGGKSLKLIE